MVAVTTGEAGQLHQPGDPLYGVTAEMLKGTGPYLHTQIQLQFPAIIDQRAAQLTLRALLSLPGEKKALPFASVEQVPGELYAKFIDQSRQPNVVAQDCKRFAFTVPSINKQALAKRYEWLVLL